jgi:aspartyl-tRNA(Asn)/glutamyl-tRNA(Gln) amidotransferase subunit A
LSPRALHTRAPERLDEETSARLRALPATEIAALVRRGDVDPAALVRACLTEIGAEFTLRAVLARAPVSALRRAKRGVDGPLAGVPLLVKDLLDTAGIPTTYGSQIFRDHVPDRTATAVRRLEDAGALVIGKANLHEFAWGLTGQNPHWGFVQNPVRPGRVAGGSSAGNAAALAADLCALGIGTDTGGSVRVPAACCQVVGFKPSHGRVPVDGCFPLAPSFDTVGPMARTVRDCAVAYGAMAGEAVPEPATGALRVGVLVDVPERERLEGIGWELVDARLPEPEADINPLFFHECALSHRDLFPERRQDYAPDARMKWDAAFDVAAMDVVIAREALESWRARAASEPDVDLLVSPVLAIEPPPIDVWEPDVREALSRYTRPFNQLGWPAIAIGDLQIAGRDDRTVLAAALAWEEAYGAPGARDAAAEVEATG